MSGTAPALRARQLGREYDGYVALTSVELEVNPGEFVALVGPNGAGKTTFLSLAAGLLEASAGYVEIGGARAGSIEARRAVSYLPDTPVFYEDLSIAEHLEYVAALHGLEPAGPRIDSLLDRLDLSDRRDGLPAELSHGMQQKASIAIAFARPFALLLADEPFDGLDPPSREALFELFAEARAAGAALIASSHRSDVIAAAGRCIGIRGGELAYDGPADASALDGFFDSPAPR
jgi:ABC-type multidrug transport system ATPase subunit